MPNLRRNTRSLSPGIILVPVLLIGCLLIVGLSYGVITIPRQAEKVFGPASPKLSAFQKLNYSIQLLLNQDNLSNPKDPSGKDQVFKIDIGQSAGNVAAQLQENGIISSADAFRIYLVYSGLDTGLQAGSYNLNPGLSPFVIAHKIQDATPEDIPFHILAGWRIEEIAAALPTSGLSVTQDEFIQAATHLSNDLNLGLLSGQVTSLEGSLLPGSYTFKRDATTQVMLNAFLRAFNQQVNPDILAGFKRQNLSVYEGLTLASIVQKEAVIDEEQPINASVFLNRIAAKMKLDSDPTVQYALGYNATQKTWWTNPLSRDDLQVESPYNTYLSSGLPPGPICNPSISAIQAVAFPAQTPYYYFRARCDGSGKHLFAATLAEQIKNACP